MTEEKKTKSIPLESKDKKIKSLEQKVEELENNWKRALADYRNYEKRAEEEKENFVKFANSLLISRLIPVMDNMEMLSKHIDDTGLRMILKEFTQIMNEEGVKEIDSFERDFDPETMEAIEMVEGDKNKVIEVIQKGYTYKQKLIRPARVKVGKGN